MPMNVTDPLDDTPQPLMTLWKMLMVAPGSLSAAWTARYWPSLRRKPLEWRRFMVRGFRYRGFRAFVAHGRH